MSVTSRTFLAEPWFASIVVKERVSLCVAGSSITSPKSWNAAPLSGLTETSRDGAIAERGIFVRVCGGIYSILGGEVELNSQL